MLRSFLTFAILIISIGAHAGSIADEYRQRGVDQALAARQQTDAELRREIPRNAEGAAKAKVVGNPEPVAAEGNSWVNYYYRMSNGLRCRVPVNIDRDGYITFVWRAYCQ